MNTAPTSMPAVTIPPWFNRTITVLLKTPGIQRVLGSTLALVTVTGRTTGRRYTTPVTYYQDGETVLFVTKRSRRWWRNMLVNPEVELRLAGRMVNGEATLYVGDVQQLPVFVEFLTHRRRDARAYGVTCDRHGNVDEREARAVMPDLVIVRVALVGVAHLAVTA